jgi:hypothetical protein
LIGRVTLKTKVLQNWGLQVKKLKRIVWRGIRQEEAVATVAGKATNVKYPIGNNFKMLVFQLK